MKGVRKGRVALIVLLLALSPPVMLALGAWVSGRVDLPRFFQPDEQADVYQDVVDKIDDGFYRKVDRDKISDKALTAAVEGLDDPFSSYVTPGQYAQFSADTRGNFEGVGTSIREVKRGLEVITVFEGGPAAKAGLKRGDLIVAVNGKSLRGVPSDDATTQIKGPAGTQVKLTIVTDGKRRVETITRAKVNVPVSEKRMETEDGEKIGYVSLTQFTAGAHGYVGGHVRDLLKRGAKGLVLDLRHNGGGLLEEGRLVASLFLPDGLIVSTRGRNRKEERLTATGDAIDTKIPMTVLVDRGTASASEIVTGALQDRDRATVLGERTFGKGVFQEVVDLENGGALKLTVGEYYTPKGRNLGPSKGKRGLTPDVLIKDDPKTKRDEVLQRGLQVVAGEL